MTAEIVIYTKDYCPFCHRAKALLDKLGQKYTEIDLQAQPDRRDEMIAKAGGKTTVPQVFIGGQHVGGCDDLFAAHNSGALTKLLKS